MTRVFERAIGWGACAGAILLLIAALAGVRVEAASDLRVENAVVRLATVPGRPAAAYFNLRGGPAVLVAVTSPLADRVELHSSSMAGGVMRMDKLPSVAVRPDAAVRFAPGGNHLMLFGVRADVKPGAAVPLLFRFEGGRTVGVEARAVAPGAAIADPAPHAGH